MTRQRTFAVTLRVAADGDAIRGLRTFLKIAGRHFGLRATSIRETTNTTSPRRSAEWCNHASVGKGQTTMTSLRKYGPANKFIKFEELHDKPPMRERIGLVKPELGKFGERLVLTFEPSGRMLSLNKTSVGNLLRDLGEDDSDWVGQLVEVYAGEVETQNGPADAILVRAVDVPAGAAAKAAKSTKAKSSKPSESMDDEIPF
jgi:hypothetical protein